MPFNSFENYPMTWKPTLNKSKNTPLYLEIVRALGADIESGVLHPNDKLPPQRELADYLDINLSTVTRAFKVCAAKGLISGTIGRGTYIAADVLTRLPMLDERGLEHCINMGASHPLYEQNKYVAATMKQVMRKINVESLLRYTQTTGRLSQKNTAKNWLMKFGIQTETQNILITSGLQNSIAIVISALFQYGDKIATNSLTYPGIKNISNMLGVQLVPIPYINMQMDIEALHRQCKSEHIKGLFIAPDHHNPTALTMTMRERNTTAEIIRKQNLLCIEDGTYSFLSRKILPTVTSMVPDKSVYISTVSNSLCAGLRIAFLVTPTSLIEPLTGAINNINVMSSPFESEIVSQLIATGVADTIVQEKLAEIHIRNSIANDVLSGFALWGDSNSQFRYLLLPQNWTGQGFEIAAKEKGVQIFCNERFAVGNAVTSPAVRIALCSPDNRDEMERGLYIIKEILKA